MRATWAWAQAIECDDKFTSKTGMVCRRVGRPVEPEKTERARVQLAKGVGIAKTARLTNIGSCTV